MKPCGRNSGVARRGPSLAVLVALSWSAGLTIVCDDRGEPVTLSDSQGGSGEGTIEPARTGGAPRTLADRHGLTAEPAAAPLEILDFGPPAPTIFFIAGLKGYTEPCGCTAGLQVGGLDRLVGYIDAARRLQPASVVIDAGNLLFEFAELPEHMRAQERRKAALLVEAQHRLGTISTTPGPTDLALGLETYRELVVDSGLPVVAANLRAADGGRLAQPYVTARVGDLTIGVVGAVDPPLFAARSDVVADSPQPAVAEAVAALSAQGVDTVILVVQGDLEASRALAAAAPGVDFTIVGHDPAETDRVDVESGVPVLQAFDQGRYVGTLKLYAGVDGAYRDARQQDDEAVGRIDRRLDYLRTQLALLPPALQGEEPEIVVRMREQIGELEAERLALRYAQIDVPAEGGAFLFWPVALEPGYPEDAGTTARMEAFNAALAELNAGRTEIEPLGPRDIGFVGIDVCGSCHRAAYDVWSSTPHAIAIETLEARDKVFDESCVGCHVTGFRQPGGSVTGNHNGLADVQCEACHGPGAAHVREPPGHILRVTPAETCRGCHAPDHSPSFDYGRYLPLVLGPGHGS